MFLTWLRNWVLLTVFLKSCIFSENTIFMVFSAKHSLSKNKIECWKNRNFMKNSGLLLNMAKWCFGFFFRFHVFVVCFWCVWHSSKSVKNVCFSQFWGAFVGWFILACLGLEGLGVFVFLVFVFLFCVIFVSVLFALLLFCCWIVLGVGSCFVFCCFCFLFCSFCFLVFVFFGRV